MKILEIFQSIQGEGSMIGKSVVFIRTAGCNLKCSFCDTKESWQVKNAKEMTIQEILEEVEKYKTDKIIITGGEPCIQSDIQELINLLHSKKYYIAIETNATQKTPLVDWIVASPKEDSKYFINSECKANELKYVITENFDEKVITEEIREKFNGKIWLQPNGYDMKKTWKKAYEMVIKDNRLRVGIQLHKIMEVK